ncbi:MAG: hypothetical protein EU529_14795 [Promethearchaeota archaeon]|nr:MAG: hypothetical protein EU529_14795 [Candidatus Lokiarchaeota archaeon]
MKPPKTLKTCVGCGGIFIQTHNAQKFCNDECRKITYYENHKEAMKKRAKQYRKDNKELILKNRKNKGFAYMSGEIEFYYDKIVKICDLPDGDALKEKCVEKFLEIWSKIKKGTIGR